MSSTPSVAVLMCVYNECPHLKTAIESILEQTWSSFRFVVVDDASTDGSSELLTEYAASDDRINLVENESNIGLTPSLNRGLEEISSDYVVRIDGDDISAPERIERQVKFMERRERVVVAGTWYDVIDEDGTQIDHVEFPTNSDEVRSVLIKYNPLLHSSTILRRDVVDRVGGYDIRYSRAQDYDLWLRLAQHGEIVNIPETLATRRYTSDCVSLNAEDEQLRCAIRARIEAIRRGQYPLTAGRYLLKPTLKYLLPAQARNTIRKFV